MFQDIKFTDDQWDKIMTAYEKLAKDPAVKKKLQEESIAKEVEAGDIRSAAEHLDDSYTGFHQNKDVLVGATYGDGGAPLMIYRPEKPYAPMLAGTDLCGGC